MTALVIICCTSACLVTSTRNQLASPPLFLMEATVFSAPASSTSPITHLRALSRKGNSGCAPDAGCAARNDDDLSCREICHSKLIPDAGRAAEKRDELAPSYGPSLTPRTTPYHRVEKKRCCASHKIGPLVSVQGHELPRHVAERAAVMPPKVAALSRDQGGRGGPRIGIGGSLAAPPLPHHRAYGSVHGGSRSCANTPGTRMGARAI